jgi:hypothetical protein
MEKYFKKPNGVIVKMHKYHNEDNLKARFIECDAEGNEIKKEKPKAKAKPKPKAKAKKKAEGADE